VFVVIVEQYSYFLRRSYNLFRVVTMEDPSKIKYKIYFELHSDHTHCPRYFTKHTFSGMGCVSLIRQQNRTEQNRTEQGTLFCWESSKLV